MLNPVGDFAASVGWQDSQAKLVGRKAAKAIDCHNRFLWLILVLGIKGVRIVKTQVHRVLDRGYLVGILAMLPACTTAGIHCRSIGFVVFRRLWMLVVTLGNLFGSHVKILVPQFSVCRPVVDKLASIAVPLGHELGVKHPVGNVTLSDHRHRTEASDPFPWSSKTEDRTADHLFPLRALSIR